MKEICIYHFRAVPTFTFWLKYYYNYAFDAFMRFLNIHQFFYLLGFDQDGLSLPLYAVFPIYESHPEYPPGKTVLDTLDEIFNLCTFLLQILFSTPVTILQPVILCLVKSNYSLRYRGDSFCCSPGSHHSQSGIHPDTCFNDCCQLPDLCLLAPVTHQYFFGHVHFYHPPLCHTFPPGIPARSYCPLPGCPQAPDPIRGAPRTGSRHQPVDQVTHCHRRASICRPCSRIMPRAW